MINRKGSALGYLPKAPNGAREESLGGNRLLRNCGVSPQMIERLALSRRMRAQARAPARAGQNYSGIIPASPRQSPETPPGHRESSN